MAETEATELLREIGRFHNLFPHTIPRASDARCSSQNLEVDGSFASIQAVAGQLSRTRNRTLVHVRANGGFRPIPAISVLGLWVISFSHRLGRCHMNIRLRFQGSSALACCLLLISSPAHPTATSPSQRAAAAEEAQLVTRTNEWIAAINRKDRPKLESLMAPNFVLHAWDESWSVDRSAWLKNLEKYHLDEYRHWSIVPRIYGEAGVVTSKWYWRGTKDSKPFEEHGSVVDVWQHKLNGWQVVSRITIIEPGKE